jgi:chemotaxis protein CheC
MIVARYSEDEYDYLKEIFNVAMGRAGSDLAVLLKSFVDLKVPDIEIVAAENIVDKILKGSVFKETEIITAFKQSFHNSAFLNGVAVVVFDKKTKQSLSDILGITDIDSLEEIDFMLELSNMLVGACMNSISKQLLADDMTFSPPAMICERQELQKMAYDVFQRSKLEWEYTLLAKITFKLKDKEFLCDLILSMSEEAINRLHEAISKLLSEDI